MIVDSIMQWITNFFLWVINLFPNTPAGLDSLADSISVVIGYLNSTFVPVDTLLTVIGIVIFVWVVLISIKAIMMIVNLIRGSGA